MGNCCTAGASSKTTKGRAQQTCCINELAVDVDIWINEGGPFARIPAGGRQTIGLKHVDPKTTRGKISWKATHVRASTMHRGSSHVIVVASGQVGIDLRGVQYVFYPIVVDRGSMVSIEGGLDLLALTRVIDIQIGWRAVMLRRKEARAKRRRAAAIVIQSQTRGRLARRPTTCSICLSEMPFGAKVSTVPSERCHRICRHCARQYVDSQIADGRLYIRCPGEGCQHLMEAEAFASAPAIEQYRASLRASHHERVATETDATFVDFAARHARACPRCAVLIWRSGGCDHMQCRCGHHFQWTDQEAQVRRPGGRGEAGAGDAGESGGGEGRQRGVQPSSEPAEELNDEPMTAGPRVAPDADAAVLDDGLHADDAPHADQLAIERFVALPGNEVCHDCGSHAFGAERPPWVSLSYGVVLCLECAGHHRQMGAHVSAVRSTTLDDLPAADVMTLNLMGGNRAHSHFVEQQLVDVRWDEMAVDERREWYRSAADATVYRQRAAVLRDELRGDFRGGDTDAQGTLLRGSHAPAWVLDLVDSGPAADGARARREVNLTPQRTEGRPHPMRRRGRRPQHAADRA